MRAKLLYLAAFTEVGTLGAAIARAGHVLTVHCGALQILAGGTVVAIMLGAPAVLGHR